MSRTRLGVRVRAVATRTAAGVESFSGWGSETSLGLGIRLRGLRWSETVFIYLPWL